MVRHRWRFPAEAESGETATADVQRQLLIEGELAVRSRLTVVQGYSQLLERVAARNEPEIGHMRRYAVSLQDESAKLGQLLTQYFAAARLQWDPSALAVSPVPLAQLADSVVATFAEQPALRQGRRLWVEALDDVQGIWDARWLGDALAALVSNALTYSPVGSEIRVMVRHENGHALVVVEDPGEGIEESEETVIFDPFRRGSAAARLDANGWGLGLFIASRAVMVHGGWLEVESGAGEGSTFRVHLPLLSGLPLSA